MKYFAISILSLFLASCTLKNNQENTKPGKTIVTPETFIRAETDRAFVEMIKNAGKTNAFYHFRKPTPLDKQSVIRMNRDVLYSGGVFDARKGLSITFPELPDTRYASIYIIDNDHYVEELIYKPGRYQINGNTDFLYIIIRLQVLNPDDLIEINMLNNLQDLFIVESISKQEFPEFKWDIQSLDSLRSKYNQESAHYSSWAGMMGKRGSVNEKTRHIAAAAAWGLLPEEAATYMNYKPENISLDSCYTATYKIPENNGFWSITIYGDDGYIKTDNCLLNNSNVHLNSDSTFTVYYGPQEICDSQKNRLDTPSGWNFLYRIYLPGNEVLSGEYLIPEVQSVK